MFKMCSVDCGLDGGIAIFENQSLVHLERMPTMVFDNGNVINVESVSNMFKDSDVIVVERQFNPQGKPQKGGFTNGSNYGAIVTLARIYGKEVIVVGSHEWKATFNLLNTPSRSKFRPKITKKDSVITANKIFGLNIRPNLDGVSEALLIAEHYRINISNTLRFGVKVQPEFIKRERTLRTLI